MICICLCGNNEKQLVEAMNFQHSWHVILPLVYVSTVTQTLALLIKLPYCMYHNQLFAACWVQRKSDTKSLRCLSRHRNPSRVDSDCIGFDRQLCVKLILLFVAALPHHGSKRVGRSLIDEDMAAAVPSSLGGSSFSPSASAGVRPKSSQRKKECTPLP